MFPSLAEQGPSGTPGYDERGAIAGLGSNQDMLALKRQMEELGLQVKAKPNTLVPVLRMREARFPYIRDGNRSPWWRAELHCQHRILRDGGEEIQEYDETQAQWGKR